jgi:formylglycine-generating enzyme required for sulfatase activity
MINFLSVILLIMTCSFASASLSPMSFVTVKANTFLMGSAESEGGRSFDESLHFVTLSEDYQMQTTTVTQEQWVALMHSNPSQFKNKIDCTEDFALIDGIALCSKHPVETVTFSSVLEFIQKLNSEDKSFNYRLPTESEWERAARGGHGTAYFFSDDGTNIEKYVVLNADRTSPVASKLPNDFGLYDMLGNVSQWVQDYYGYYPTWDLEKPSLDPRGPLRGDYRIVRGGDWYDYMWNHFRSASRKFVEAQSFSSLTGFRLIRFSK